MSRQAHDGMIMFNKRIGSSNEIGKWCKDPKIKNLLFNPASLLWDLFRPTLHGVSTTADDGNRYSSICPILFLSSESYICLLMQSLSTHDRNWRELIKPNVMMPWHDAIWVVEWGIIVMDDYHGAILAAWCRMVHGREMKIPSARGLYKRHRMSVPLLLRAYSKKVPHR